MSYMQDPINLSFIGNQTAREIDETLKKAKEKHGHAGNFKSRHEGYAVLLEEVDELWDEVKKDGTPEEFRKEVLQVAAMCIRILEELK